MGLDDEIWIVDFLRAVIVFMFAAWLVDNCNCISIMWSPSLIVRLRGAAPERKSFTWVSFRLSKACITDCSGFGLMSPVSARGRRVTVLPSTSRFVPIEPSTNSLSLYRR